jgi:glycosyltransferase involved in cell wall biosynthesis
MLGTVEALSGRGWQVVVILPAPGPLVAELQARGALVEFCPTPVVRKSMLTPRGLGALLVTVVRGLPRSIRLIRSHHVDLVYVSTITLPLWVLVGRLLRRPVVCHVHEAERMLPRTVRRVMALPLLAANRVIANSEFTRNVLADTFGALRDRTDVITNGVEAPSSTRPPRSELTGPLRLVFVGRLSPRKGPQVAVELLEELLRRGVDSRLDIVGSVFPGYEWFEEDLTAQIAAASVTDKVDFHGFVDDVSGAISEADLVLVPSQADESFGNIAIEALLASRPVLVSDISGLAEAVAGYRAAQTVVPDSVDQWVEGVLRVTADWPTYRRAAADDALLAAERHAPSRYREEMAGRLSGLARK